MRVTADHGLEVRGVGADDGGQYTCQLDVWGHTQTAVHNLTVLGTFIPYLDIFIFIQYHIPVKYHIQIIILHTTAFTRHYIM